MYNTTIDYHAGIFSIFSRTSCTQSWRPVTMASFLMKLNHAMKSVYMICCYILSGTAFIFRTLRNHRGRDWKPDQLTPINKYSPGSSSPQASHKFKLSNKAIHGLTKLLHVFCPSPHCLPQSEYMIKKLSKQFSVPYKHCTICTTCGVNVKSNAVPV